MHNFRSHRLQSLQLCQQTFPPYQEAGQCPCCAHAARPPHAASGALRCTAGNSHIIHMHISTLVNNAHRVRCNTIGAPSCMSTPQALRVRPVAWNSFLYQCLCWPPSHRTHRALQTAYAGSTPCECMTMANTHARAAGISASSIAHSTCSDSPTSMHIAISSGASGVHTQTAQVLHLEIQRPPSQAHRKHARLTDPSMSSPLHEAATGLIPLEALQLDGRPHVVSPRFQPAIITCIYTHI
jgi:hypothetical protein